MTVSSTARQAEALAAVRQALRLGTAFFLYRAATAAPR